jgi:acyl-CoA thioesterase-1
MDLRVRPKALHAALAGVIVLVPVAALPQERTAETTSDAAASVVLPTALPTLSPECLPKRSLVNDRRWPLRGIRTAIGTAIRTHHTVKVLAIGSSSTAGVGASSPSTSYIARLETTLEGSVKGMDFDVVGRGQSGEVAQGAADRMKKEVEETKPDLVVWQVGTNDAIRHVDIDRFKTCLKTTLAWLVDNKIDVVLIDPQYGDALTRDAYYQKVVTAIADVAHDARVLLVDRFEAMRELQHERGDQFYMTSDNLHLNDTGHRCMAEQLARAIVGGLLQANSESDRSLFMHP